jgi:hypothetical protein
MKRIVQDENIYVNPAPENKTRVAFFAERSAAWHRHICKAAAIDNDDGCGKEKVC